MRPTTLRGAAALALGMLAMAFGAGCGSSGSSATASGPGSAPVSATSSAAGSSATVPSASAAGAGFSCAIKPGHGLLPGQTPAPGRILATVDQIESAIGFPIDTSVNISEVAGLTECRYMFTGGSDIDVAILDDPAQTDTEYAKTQSQKLALHDRSCNGCSLDSITATSGLGDKSYMAKSNDGSTAIGVIASGVYFELDSISLKTARMQRLAATMVGTLTGTTPSLEPLPTPTPSS